jgi:nucleotide-binding universal stress UspA family protein
MPAAITRILVPVDLNHHSARAFEYAAMLARQFGASLELLHVIDDPFVSGAWSADGFDPYIPDLINRLVDDARQRLRDMKDVVAMDGDEVEPVVLTGAPAPTIVDRAAAGAFDLIVMGTHGRRGLAHALMGSVAERVVRTAPCPVVTVPNLTAADRPTVVELAARTVLA